MSRRELPLLAGGLYPNFGKSMKHGCAGCARSRAEGRLSAVREDGRVAVKANAHISRRLEFRVRSGRRIMTGSDALHEGCSVLCCARSGDDEKVVREQVGHGFGVALIPSREELLFSFQELRLSRIGSQAKKRAVLQL